MASIEELDQKCLENYGFDLRETYKVTVKFYKGMKKMNESFENVSLVIFKQKKIYLENRKIP